MAAESSTKSSERSSVTIAKLSGSVPSYANLVDCEWAKVLLDLIRDDIKVVDGDGGRQLWKWDTATNSWFSIKAKELNLMVSTRLREKLKAENVSSKHRKLYCSTSKVRLVYGNLSSLVVPDMNPSDTMDDWLPLSDGTNINVFTNEIRLRTREDNITHQLPFSGQALVQPASALLLNLARVGAFFESYCASHPPDFKPWFLYTLRYLLSGRVDKSHFSLYHFLTNTQEDILFSTMRVLLGPQLCINLSRNILYANDDSGTTYHADMARLSNIRLLTYHEIARYPNRKANETMLKRVTSGQSMVVWPPYAKTQGIVVKLKAKICVIGDRLLQVADPNPSFMERNCFVELPMSNPDPTFGDWLSSLAGTEALLAYILTGPKEPPTLPAEVSSFTETVKIESKFDPVKDFYNTVLYQTSYGETWTDATTLSKAFERWCKNKGYPFCGSANFWLQLKALVGPEGYQKSGKMECYNQIIDRSKI